jgi:STE24 endopeptidase
MLFSGGTVALERTVVSLVGNPYVEVLLFAGILGLAGGVLTFPFGFYSGYVLEHSYGLSNQTMPAWAWERMKGVLVSAAIGAPLLAVFYYLLTAMPEYWWLAVATVMFVVSVGLSRIAPLVILPLFYRLTPLDASPLRERIIDLAKTTSMIVEGIYSFNLSKTTKKANAAFTGIGRSKRILLGDTLLGSFTEEEVEVVFAHELGHYTRGHIWKGIAFGTVSVYVGLFLTAQAYGASLGWFGFSSASQLAALPLLALWLALYSLVTSPLGNMLSRKHEFEADRYAVERTGKKEAFVSSMRKLASMNLADTTPHPLVEFFFYSHPSIEKRIAAAEAL